MKNVKNVIVVVIVIKKAANVVVTPVNILHGVKLRWIWNNGNFRHI